MLRILQKGKRLLHSDTIFALATAQGKAGVGIIRISGSEAGQALARILPEGRLAKVLSTPRKLFHTEFRDPATLDVLDSGMVVYFPNPHSFTGEDVAELHIHSAKATIARFYAVLAGLARIAEPGEFTRRAFLSGKLDLTQVEGLADLLAAETELQRKFALAQMDGRQSCIFAEWRGEIIRAMAMTEAWIDFSEDELIEDETLANVRSAVTALVERIERQLAQTHIGEIVRSGFRVALCGPPNAGKSSILNMLVRRDAAIVSPVAGTTRDVLQASLDIGGIPVILSDTAGIREAAHDAIEQEGIRRALKTAEQADHVLFVLDGSVAKTDPTWIDQLSRLDPAKTSLVLNKVDLLGDVDVAGIRSMLPPDLCDVRIFLNSCSVPDATFIGPFSDLVASRLGETATDALPVIVNARQEAHARTAVQHLGESLLQRDVVLAAEHLRQAANAIGKITGHIDAEDVLDVLFSTFCIGK